MKFSHSVQFNAVPDWSANYIAYSNLKKLIYTLEKSLNQSHQAEDLQDNETSALLSGPDADPDQVFKKALDAELEKICTFYQLKELELFGELDDVLKDADSFDGDLGDVDEDQIPYRYNTQAKGRQGSILNAFGIVRRNSTLGASTVDRDDSDEDEDDENTALTKSVSAKGRTRTWDEDARSSRELPRRRLSVSFDEIEPLYAAGLTLKKRVTNIFVSLCELKSFIQLNKTGFSKALKKYDKTLDRNMRKDYLDDHVSASYPFRKQTMQHIDENIAKVEKAYAELATAKDLGAAKRELRLHLREHVVWERNTVWREMIGVERKAQAANLGLRQTLLGGDHQSRARLQGDEVDDGGTKEVSTPLGKLRVPAWLAGIHFFTIISILVVFGVLLAVPILESPEQQNCLAMLVLVSLFWATEAIPLFVTSLLIPFLVVILRVVREDEKPHRRLGSKQAASYIFASMWTPVIILLLGGFAIAAALSKYHIAKRLATLVLSKAGTRPRTVLLTNMFVAMIASMWISNVASPVLCFSIIQPILRNLPSDSNFSKALILGIALASNIGGMASPIASPQNIIALENMKPEPSWGAWFFVSLPVCIISILGIWIILLISFNPGKGTTIVPIRPVKDKFTGVQWLISIVTVATIILWCFSHQLENVFGDMGVVAIIPLVIFFGTGILTKEDFNNFLWTIIILAAGGLSLGKAVNSSGLLHTIADYIKNGVTGMSLYGVLLVFSGLVLVIASFISHTVAALIVLPIVRQVGLSMENPHPNLLVMSAALMCSAAMALPTSGFPNMTAIMMEDPQTGQRYLRVQHFISRGIPASLLTFIVVVSLGYLLMLIAKY